MTASRPPRARGDSNPGPLDIRKGAATTTITERVGALDAQLDVQTAPGQGTAITNAVPVHDMSR